MALAQIPCHYRELFIQNTGYIYPCCRVWNREDLRIGHIQDADIFDKIQNFQPPSCKCEDAVLRSGTADDVMLIELLNLETSLSCQATCAMCCVNAPEWRGTYDLYDDIAALIARLSASPREMLVQGGEVLVQKKSMKLMRALRAAHPTMRMSVITNGNAPDAMLDEALAIFDRFTLSVYAFQSDTYNRISGLDLGRTKEFAESVVAAVPKKDLYLKYLTTPLNAHETSSFLKWAIGVHPKCIILTNAMVLKYIQGTPDEYWKKIFKRTGDEIKKVLVSSDLDPLRSCDGGIYLDKLHADVYGVDEDFLEKYGLSDLVRRYGLWEYDFGEWRQEKGRDLALERELDRLSGTNA